MLINSKFQDYYDSCLGYGIDKKVVYNREPRYFTDVVRSSSEGYGHSLLSKVSIKEINMTKAACNGWGPDMTNHREMYRRHGVCTYSSIAVLGFCGTLTKVYLSYTYRASDIVHGKYVEGGWVSDMYMSAEKMPEDLKKRRLGYFDKGTIGDSFKEVMERKNDDLFLELNAPVFLAYSDFLIVNPELKKLGFSKIKDGVSAFQEISAYISGTLNANRVEPEPITDVLRAQTHGFDKNSFRKAPTKRGK